MNIYDTVNNLAKEIQESDEYKTYSTAKNNISSNLEKKSQLEEFEKLRYEVQLSAMQGNKQDDDMMKKLQEKYSNLINDEEMRIYFEAEMKFNIMMSDINKIIAEAVKGVI